MTRLVRSAVLFGVMLVLVGCGAGGGSGDGSDPVVSMDAQRAATAYNAAVDAALEGAVGVDHTQDTATLDGSVEVDGVLVSFHGLVLEKRPYAVRGTATLEEAGSTAVIEFSGGVTGALDIDGDSADTLRADFPADPEFARAEASWAIESSFGSAGGTGFAAGVTVTDNGDGTFTLDGTIDAGGILVDLDMVTIDPVNMTIDGTTTIDDGNGNTVVLDFNGTTVDVTVNGQLVGTFDLSGIFGP